jgi:hypothetical protein
MLDYQMAGRRVVQRVAQRAALMVGLMAEN